VLVVAPVQGVAPVLVLVEGIARVLAHVPALELADAKTAHPRAPNEHCTSTMPPTRTGARTSPERKR
jgi:hypothetical protein